jgi:hypothetical protein
MHNQSHYNYKRLQMFQFLQIQAPISQMIRISILTTLEQVTIFNTLIDFNNRNPSTQLQTTKMLITNATLEEM